MSGVNGNDTLARLAEVIEQRRTGDPEKSYVARLFHKGTDAILKKVGEEATEVVMACKDGERTKIVAEVADLLAELQRREGMSGLEEFAARKAIVRENGEP
jgi:phosphoribosyl-ATP pyrophosphohydrolase